MILTRRVFFKLALGTLVSSQFGCDLSTPPDLDRKKVLLVYWLISITQPNNHNSIVHFLNIIDDSLLDKVSRSEVSRSLDILVKEGYLLKFYKGGETFYTGMPENEFKLTTKERLNRDRLRFFLLSSLNKSSLHSSREGCKLIVDGDSPSLEERLPIQLRVGLDGRRSQPSNSSWVSLIESTPFTAFSFSSPLSPFHRPLSYPDSSFISKINTDIPEHLIVRRVLAIDLGFSPQLVTRIIKNKNEYYRTFKIEKKSGGYRIVSSPRTYLKVILRYVKSNLLADLVIHESVHSYRKDRSFVSNAVQYENNKYVLNIDLEDYFSSITIHKVRKILRDNGFSYYGSIFLSTLCTLDNVLPQGAPTSPIISNAVLYELDNSMFRYCKKNNLNYTRYSDDITISGDSRGNVDKAKSRLIAMIGSAGFRVNNKKVRLMTYKKQQIVTGVVVNSIATPPRSEMRKIRAKFHNASKSIIEANVKKELWGYISYLSAFNKYRNSELLSKYKMILSGSNVK